MRLSRLLSEIIHVKPTWNSCCYWKSYNKSDRSGKMAELTPKFTWGCLWVLCLVVVQFSQDGIEVVRVCSAFSFTAFLQEQLEVRNCSGRSP